MGEALFHYFEGILRTSFSHSWHIHLRQLNLQQIDQSSLDLGLFKEEIWSELVLEKAPRPYIWFYKIVL